MRGYPMRLISYNGLALTTPRALRRSPDTYIALMLVSGKPGALALRLAECDCDMDSGGNPRCELPHMSRPPHRCVRALLCGVRRAPTAEPHGRGAIKYSYFFIVIEFIISCAIGFQSFICFSFALTVTIKSAPSKSVKNIRL